MDAPVIVATRVPERSRLRFLPGLFGARGMMRGEAQIYATARALSEDYTGGSWTFWRLSNGGGYLAPQTPERLRVCVTGNQFDGVVSGDAFGIIVTLFVLNAIIWRMADSGGDPEPLSGLYHALRRFACGHAEASLILRAID
ncbi:antirestriction protein [Paraburkholderia adhaesiva]|uniref:antirestriction protein n=1 Tax=Paraburkholderia adhaesiva TaxID=2883244 RepID=UPI001F1CE971|nr:antirestriction protein [Paraburkholderia adhaesiva]